MGAGVVLSFNERKGHSQDGTGPGAFGPDYSDRKKYHQEELKRHKSEWINAFDDGRTVRPPKNGAKEEKKMACDNIECNCEGCTCDPCTCTPDNLCGCAEDHSNDWKGVV